MLLLRLKTFRSATLPLVVLDAIQSFLSHNKWFNPCTARSGNNQAKVLEYLQCWIVDTFYLVPFPVSNSFKCFLSLADQNTIERKSRQFETLYLVLLSSQQLFNRYQDAQSVLNLAHVFNHNLQLSCNVICASNHLIHLLPCGNRPTGADTVNAV